jgi:hypothetical protein
MVRGDGNKKSYNAKKIIKLKKKIRYLTRKLTRKFDY